MGVGPLAIYLSQLGFRVTGEDDALTEDMRLQLERAGVGLTLPGAVPDACELLVSSSAISPLHPAAKKARERNIPQFRRGEVLAEVTRGKRFVAICGSHGKTTTTAMLATILRKLNFPAGYILGGLFAEESWAPARVGSNDWVVAEVDESDGTIERFSPSLTVAVNLDWDHPDHYRQQGDLEATFRALFARTLEKVLIRDTCVLSQRVAAGLAVDRFGRTGDFQGTTQRVTPEGTVVALGGRFLMSQALVRTHGEFNVANATAALAAAQLMGVELKDDVLASFPGVRRRQSVLLNDSQVTALEDYAHHPAEIRALLESLRQRLGTHTEAPQGRLVVAFQPHRFSRTAQFKTEFAASLALADSVHLLDVYGAGESALSGGTTADLYAELKRVAPQLSVTYFPGDKVGFHRALSQDIRRGDLLAFVGAGDIDREARVWLSTYRQKQSDAARWDERAEHLRANLSPTSKVIREESLAGRTTLRVGGAARILCEPSSLADLQTMVAYAHQQTIPLHILGRGSNLLVPDAGVEGLVLSLTHPQWQTFELRPEGRVWAGAGLRLKNLCGLAAKAGLVGFEFLEGIPGNVGGALRMNAGAMGGWMFDVVEEIQVMTREGKVFTWPKAQLHVEYRHCLELDEAIALGALLKPASAAESEQIKRQIDTYRDKRQKTQPRDPSAGCIFKNPPGDSAGRLIDAAGLKGERRGDAEVSLVHANFIVNRGHASSADVIALVRHVRARVQEASGVTLEPEVLLYGQEWKDVL